MQDFDNTAGEVIEITVRAPCRVCGRPFVLPKGQRAPAGVGPCCQTSLLEEPSGRPERPERPDGSSSSEVADDEPELPPARDLGHLGLTDVLCEGCRERPAAGRLTPGSALCLDCAGEVVEHWLATLESPYHEWWPGDDPFGSCRYPVPGWREVER